MTLKNLIKILKTLLQEVGGDATVSIHIDYGGLQDHTGGWKEEFDLRVINPDTKKIFVITFTSEGEE